MAHQPMGYLMQKFSSFVNDCNNYFQYYFAFFLFFNYTFYLPVFICLHTVIYIKYSYLIQVICTQLYDRKSF